MQYSWVPDVWMPPDTQDPTEVLLQFSSGMLSVWLCTKEQAGSYKFHIDVLDSTGKRIAVVGVASGIGVQQITRSMWR